MAETKKDRKVIIKTLDGVCLVNLDYLAPEGLDDLLNAKPGSIVRVTDIHNAVRFIDYPKAIKDKV